MKKRECSYEDCGLRRIHHEKQEQMRGVQIIDVNDDYPDDKPAYCSYTCALLDGAISLKEKQFDFDLNKK